MVYWELGCFPLSIKIKIRVISYWNRLISNQNKLCTKLYQLMYFFHNNNMYQYKWITFVQNIFNDIGLSYIFNSHIPISSSDLKLVVKQKLCDQFIQKWFSDLESSSRDFYKIIKKNFELEAYLTRLAAKDRQYITKFRLSNIKLPIETGRWHKIAKENRLCNFCRESIGDEFHILFVC